MKVQLFAACFVALTALLDFAAAASGHLTVQVAGLRGRAGNLRVSVWKDGSGFPRKPERAVARTEVAVNGPEMTVSFEGLPPGIYAVSAFQDEDADGSLDRSILGKPTEPYGFSNDARSSFMPPSFRDAAFELKQVPMTIRLTLDAQGARTP